MLYYKVVIVELLEVDTKGSIGTTVLWICRLFVRIRRHNILAELTLFETRDQNASFHEKAEVDDQVEALEVNRLLMRSRRRDVSVQLDLLEAGNEDATLLEDANVNLDATQEVSRDLTVEDVVLT